MNKIKPAMNIFARGDNAVSGEFINHAGERYYAIHNVDRMPPFLISVVSDSDHWLFISSNGSLTAGRVSPETALFPYVSVDKIHDSAAHTGSKTLLRVRFDNVSHDWEPFNKGHGGRYQINRHLYKNLPGNKILFEEVNHDLQLVFRYSWMSSDQYGFVRHCELQNLDDRTVSIDLIDGLLNVLPAGTPRLLQSSSSSLVDSYKWSELDEASGLALFTLNSGITDRPEPCESLKANTIFCLGLESHKTLISSQQLDAFRSGKSIDQETHRRGIRGAYLINHSLDIEAYASREWRFVANTEQSQGQVVALLKQLKNLDKVGQTINESIASGSDQLARIMASADGFQLVAEENVAVHHYANVLFNIQRGGGFVDQYRVSSKDFANTVSHFNIAVFQRNQEWFGSLPESLEFADLLSQVLNQNDFSLQRLCYEYLPISYGRRHGDPSRPWNQFAIKLKDEEGNRLLSYQGNWRDIFQNWEALALSYPEFIENMIAKFVNASTVDGYNPYRITKQGIDWEVEDEDDPWSFIGYWGDHQIIYLLKLLELSHSFHPDRLSDLLHRPIFCYANVPYRIKPFEALVENPKATVIYDQVLADQIEQRITRMGADGKLILDTHSEVYQVNLLEKLLVALLCKLGNLVVDGGIWLNTQRPEWNDANNALVGQGLSMVTLYYLRRYLRFLQELLVNESDSASLTLEVSIWLEETASCLAKLRPQLDKESISDEQRLLTLAELGQAASRYRQVAYQPQIFSRQVNQSIESVRMLIENALLVVDHSIVCNQRDDGLYHAYNLMDSQPSTLAVDHLYTMLEGQVAALSAGVIEPEQAVSLLEALFDSDLYRADQHSFILYPDRQLPGFLDKNRIPAEQVLAIPLLKRMLDEGEESIVYCDADGCYRFSAELSNRGELDTRLAALVTKYGNEIEVAHQGLRKLYEDVFNHQEFTGRSGGMFGFEGLGCIYWHMVSKLLLAVQENYYSARQQNADEAICNRLGQFYYRVRKGIGFNKKPAEYGAFPTDPYSHTPRHAGARQPGMTGQVKEEILSRFGELGVRVRSGAVSFEPYLLRGREFVDRPTQFKYLDVSGTWRELTVPGSGLAFTWCHMPIIYQLQDDSQPSISISWEDGRQQTIEKLLLPAEYSEELFKLSGRIQQLTITINRSLLFGD